MTRAAAALARLLGAAALLAAAAATAADVCPPLLDHRFPGLLDGKPRSLCEFSGKVVLVVNTASACGYTPQYAGLEALYKRYAARGLVVIGFPSNDFGGQEPGSNREVAEFCSVNYGVSFPMFEKGVVSGAQANALYAELAKRGDGPPRWNFHKYLIDRSGERVAAFPSAVDPDSPRFRREVEKRLAP